MVLFSVDVVFNLDIAVVVATGCVDNVVDVVGVVVADVAVGVVVAGNLKHVLLTSIFASRLC